MELNKYKEVRLKQIANKFQTKLKELQENKCRPDRIVYVSLEQNCGNENNPFVYVYCKIICNLIYE
mgnify:CR=1 FL=1